MRRLLTLGLSFLSLVIPQCSALGANRTFHIETCVSYRCPSGRAPIEITGVRNAQCEHFLADMEIDVKNVSGRPITFLDIFLSMPGVIYESGPNAYGFGVYYGRPKADTGGVEEEALIAPGATAVIKIREPYWKGFDWYVERHPLAPDATAVVELYLSAVEYGPSSEPSSY
jgi:hypothetical protein